VATITVRSGPAAGETVSLDGDVVVGREGADLTISDPELSRRHVAFRPREGAVVVEDLGSTNGTVVNGQRIDEPTTLVRDATVTIGQSELAVTLDAGVTVMRASPTTLRATPPAARATPPAEDGRPPADAPVGPPGGPPTGAPEGRPSAPGAAGGRPDGPPPHAMGGPPDGRPAGAPGGPPPGAAAKRGGATRGGMPEFVPWLIAAAAVAVAVIVAVTSGSSTKQTPTKPPPPLTISVLAKGTLQPLTAERTMTNGAKLTLDTSGAMNVQVQQLTIQPGASEPWHTHPGSGLAIIKSGVIEDYEQSGTGCKLYVLNAGDSRFDAGNGAHTLINNGKTPAVVVVTGFGPPGAPVLIPAHKPPHCSH
jgi:quercetin dioxygenase-like cupin family protein